MTQLQATSAPNQKDIVNKIFKERDTYQRATKTSREELNDIYQAYVGEMSDVKDKSLSQEKIMKLRTETNYIVPSIFSGQPELEVEEVGEEDKELAEVGEEIVNYRLQTICQAYEKIEAWVKQSVVFGTSLLNVVWRFVTKDNGDGTLTPIKDEPDLVVPNILDCFYNPIVPEVENQPSIIFRAVVPIDDVKNNPVYDVTNEITGELNRSKVEPKGNVNSNPYDSSSQVQRDSIDLQKSSEGVVEIYERITRDRIQTVVDGKERLLLRDKEYPYGFIPSVKLLHEPNAIPNRFDGFGTGHNTLGYGRLYQKMINRTFDNVNLTNNPHFLGRKGAGIDKRQLVIRPGGLTEVDGDGPLNEQIAALPMPDIKQGAVELLNKIDDEHKRASGANDLMQGAASNKTLGQDQIASTYSSNRFELINRRFKQALADVGNILLKMEIENIQSVDAPILKIFPLEEEVTDGGRIRYSRETVYQMLIAARERGDLKFNIRIKGQTNIARNKDIEIKQMTDLYNIFGPSLPPQNQMEWCRKILQLRGIDEIDKLVPDAKAMQQGIVANQPIQPQLVDQSQFGQSMIQQPGI